MVRGTKRKIPMEKIEKREYLATCFSKRSAGLYSKASQLCLLSGSQMAILATPPSSQSNVSFYSFGHSSVDSVVSAFLSGEPPVPFENTQMMREDVGSEFWWDDESLYRSENPEEIKDALDSISSLMTQLRSKMNDHNQDLKKKKKKHEPEKITVVSNHETQSLDKTLTPEPISAIDCGFDCLKTGTEIVVLDDYSTENCKVFNGEEQDQFLNNNVNDFPAENMDHDDVDELLQNIDFDSLPADGFFDNNDFPAENMDDDELFQLLKSLSADGFFDNNDQSLNHFSCS